MHTTLPGRFTEAIVAKARRSDIVEKQLGVQHPLRRSHILMAELEIGGAKSAGIKSCRDGINALT
jgi:hypothetical protein